MIKTIQAIFGKALCRINAHSLEIQETSHVNSHGYKEWGYRCARPDCEWETIYVPKNQGDTVPRLERTKRKKSK
jgi:hypothetical protein